MISAKFLAKRAHPRFTFSADAEATLKDGTTIPAQLFELSSHGCYIDTIQPIVVGSELKLRIENGLTFCELPAKVIYAHSGYGMGVFGMGVAFGELSTEQRAEIDAWISELAQNRNTTTAN
jgi:hypothetical protein